MCLSVWYHTLCFYAIWARCKTTRVERSHVILSRAPECRFLYTLSTRRRRDIRSTPGDIILKLTWRRRRKCVSIIYIYEYIYIRLGGIYATVSTHLFRTLFFFFFRYAHYNRDTWRWIQFTAISANASRETRQISHVNVIRDDTTIKVVWNTVYPLDYCSFVTRGRSDCRTECTVLGSMETAEDDKW